MYTWYMKEMSCLDAWGGGGGNNINLQYEPLEGIVFWLQKCRFLLENDHDMIYMIQDKTLCMCTQLDIAAYMYIQMIANNRTSLTEMESLTYFGQRVSGTALWNPILLLTSALNAKFWNPVNTFESLLICPDWSMSQSLHIQIKFIML